MYKERKETTHVRVGEKHTSIYKKYKYNVYQNGHKTHVQDINVSKVEKRKRYIKSSLYPSISTLPLTKISYTNSPHGFGNPWQNHDKQMNVWEKS